VKSERMKGEKCIALLFYFFSTVYCSSSSVVQLIDC